IRSNPSELKRSMELFNLHTPFVEMKERSGPDLVELASGHFGDGSRDKENIGRNEGDDDEGICRPKEIQRMECKLWNLRVRETDISYYTTRFNELMLLCPGMVPTKQKKVEDYIRGLSQNIKGEVTSSEPTTMNKAVRMAHTLMEQKVKAIAKREADNKKRK
nr:hypothetical protein [Tanacetum cinerariifolium]